MLPDIGIYYEMADSVSASIKPSLSYLTRKWPEIEAWRVRARAKVYELLAFDPEDVPLNPRIESRRVKGDIIIEEISYEMPYGPRARGFFLYPEKRRGKLPAFIALHDHSGFYYYGKEKISEVQNEPKILIEFKKKRYSGRSWANELARRGFAVLVMDNFLWGSRRIPVESLNEEFQKEFKGLKPGSEEYIRRYNSLIYKLEHVIAKTFFAAGTTWPGIFTYEDRRSIDYLLTRPEIDPARIGCGGLSGGGLRTIFLAGLDPRIKCAVCIGFMSTFRELLRNHVKCHTWMLYVPHLPRYLDLPDIITLHAPKPLMIQYNLEDQLYTLKGQREADRKIAEVYSKMGCPENYSGRFYKGPHKFDAEMQEDMFKWLQHNL